MEVAVLEEPQKKIFRARKTMKMSDRQQLEVLHNTLVTAHPNSSSQPQTPLVNGTHGEDGQKGKEKDQETGTKSPASPSSRSSPVPSRSLSLSRSPSPAENRNPSPSLKKGSEKGKGEEKKGEKDRKDDKKAEEVKADKTETTKSARTGSPSVSDKKTEQKKTPSDQVLNGTSTPSGKKRSLSPVEGKDGWKDGEIKEDRDGKRARVEGVQLEAQLELKITANAGSRLKLEKVVQQLVEERLRVLQLTVFDHSLQELKDRMEKIDAATKQQKTVQHTLQSKIARLTKKFGAANQASENSKKAQEAAAVTAAKPTPTPMTTPTTQRTVRTTLDPKLSNPSASSSSSATPTQPKPHSTPSTPTSSALAAPAPILQLITTTTNSTPSSSSSSLSGQAQTGTLLLQPRANTGAMTTSTATSAGQPMSIQPLLIQLPLAMANGQGGALAGGVGLIPVSSLGTVNSLSKAKTTTATTFILQKTAGSVVTSSSAAPSSLASSASSAVTQMPPSRPVYQGGTGTANSPNAGISVTTARAPTQCATVVGMATASSSPATTGPAATGSAAASVGPPSASEMASKTDNQSTHSAPAKSPAQPARPRGSVIDLTEDDDDVQVTGVQKATAPAIPTNTQRPQGPPPSLVSSTSVGRSAAQHRASVRSSAGRDGKAYRIVEHIPPESSEDDVSASDDEWLPEKQGGSGLANASSSDSGSEDSEGTMGGEVAEDVEGAEDVPPDRAQGQKRIRNVWKAKDNQFEGNLPRFLGEWKVNVEGTEPIDFFIHLFPEDLLDEIVHNTNLYALQHGKGNLALTTGELQIFLGINMVMSYVRHPRTRMYWSSQAGLRLDLIADAMPVNRFEEILRYLHFVDDHSQEPGNTDKLFKIRPVLNALEQTFRSAVDPEEFQSIDEQIIPFMGQQYIPKKTKPWGLKVWVRAGTSGYMYRFKVHQGLAGRGQVSEMGMAADVVMRLCDDIQRKNHKVFFDDFFCTVPLIQALLQQGIYATGTCRINRLQGAQLKLKTEQQLKTEGRGACSVISNADNITVTRWFDGSVMHMASSCAGQSPSDLAQRWSKKERKMLNIQRPFSVQLYKQHMGGLDLLDQCVAMYPHRRKNKRWYIRVFFHFLDVTIVNAWHLYRMSGLEKRDLLHFKASVACSLINAGSIKTPTRGRPSDTPPPVKRRAVSRPPPEIRFGPGKHWPLLTEDKNANRCHDAACTRKTKYVCMQCLVAVCPGCFANFHTRSMGNGHEKGVVTRGRRTRHLNHAQAPRLPFLRCH
ncbi:activating transcription factor 7-interacting protein 1 isoform X3 [Hemibagrus wyckioides]|uniref:activating transcription factor 7-interacting protein 1 isoform X3 n=1 Tax=Hemibagrus wyckioides TaxID=337641 RepID=UPI00266CFA35|nr:activating transcription factor 7-interacting protein 1 isoform X3 [Hemibagrus wyckioides]